MGRGLMVPGGGNGRSRSNVCSNNSSKHRRVMAVNLSRARAVCVRRERRVVRGTSGGDWGMLRAHAARAGLVSRRRVRCSSSRARLVRHGQVLGAIWQSAIRHPVMLLWPLKPPCQVPLPLALMILIHIRHHLELRTRTSFALFVIVTM